MFRRRLGVVAALLGFYFLVLLGRIFSMQVAEGDYWRTEAAKLSQRWLHLSARRGAIHARGGEVLAEDRLEYDLAVRLDQVDDSAWRCARCGRPAHTSRTKPPRRCRACGAGSFEAGPPVDHSALPGLLEIGPEEFEALFVVARERYEEAVREEMDRRYRRFGRANEKDVRALLLARGWTFFEGAPWAAVREVSLHPDRHHGIAVRSVYRRFRLEEEALGRVLGKLRPVTPEEGEELREQGFTYGQIWRMQVGRDGLEAGLEEQLRAKDGRRLLKRDRRGRVEEILAEELPVDGRDVHTTLDLPLQKLMYEAIGKATARHGATEGGAFVALDPRNGEVIVLASRGLGKAEPYNLAVSPVLPGSVFKVCTALAGLEAGTIEPEATFCCEDAPWRGIKCTHRHGDITVRGAISGSCNKFFAHAAEVMGIELLLPWAEKFGFNRRTEIELPEDLPGRIPSRSWKRSRFPDDPQLHVGEVRHAGFGKGYVTVSPLQAARLMAVVANGGYLIRPTLVVGGGGSGERVIDHPGTIPLVAAAMREVVTEGTGRRLGLDRFRVAGKTGTAEVKKGEAIHMAWFAGYAPAEAPRVAFAGYLRRTSVHGGTAAGDLARTFLEEFSKR